MSCSSCIEHTIRQWTYLGSVWANQRPRTCELRLLTLLIDACYFPITLEQGLGGPQRDGGFLSPKSEEIGSLGEARQPHPEKHRSEAGVSAPRALGLGDPDNIVQEQVGRPGAMLVHLRLGARRGWEK